MIQDCDLQPDGAGYRCSRCGWEFPRLVRRNCPSPAEPLPQAEVDRRLAICRACEHYALDGVRQFCRRDVVTRDGRECIRVALAAFPARLMGQWPACPRWS